MFITPWGMPPHNRFLNGGVGVGYVFVVWGVYSIVGMVLGMWLWVSTRPAGASMVVDTTVCGVVMAYGL